MTADENKQHVIDCWKAFATRDAAQIRKYFKADAVWMAPHNNATALALNVTSSVAEMSGFTGADKIADFIANDVAKVFARDVSVEFKGVYAAGHVVIVEQRMRATLFNGRHYANDYCFIFELEDGLITVMREYMDTAKGFRMIFGEEAGARMQAAGASAG
jgi:ketosteroid isomerase-like protein